MQKGGKPKLLTWKEESRYQATLFSFPACLINVLLSCISEVRGSRKYNYFM